ncbi:DUF2510 domain-containing protein [Mycolicibacterium komossense]|uniref:DUF2510 domain-containing protein n=1 Tax=Mycolicibacterium komossense TaxID=1779 RepID=A0ABT3C733_9MYCO|nr:DUF2510 domain-containing protein [Mycolicibacterium komossense]MCV7225272.1 DUF2510 domain-containing protein [Mycolicibacterium komossense]
MNNHTPPAGWYPDPTGAAQQRFWDGEQWTEALAAPTVITVPVYAPPAKDWAQRHPAWTTLIVFWIACMIWQWEWLVPVIAVTGATVWTIRWIQRRNARLAADADLQNQLLAEGDERGIYGDYPPTEEPDVDAA